MTDLLSLHLDFRDSDAAARITPAAANAYLAAHGWRHALDTANWHVWSIPDTLSQIGVPREVGPDYGDRMVGILNALAEHEGRGVLAVFVEIAGAESSRVDMVGR